MLPFLAPYYMERELAFIIPFLRENEHFKITALIFDKFI